MNQQQPNAEFGLSLSFCSVWSLVGGLLSSAVPSISNPTLKSAILAAIAAGNSVCSEPSSNIANAESLAASERLAQFGLQISEENTQFIANFSDEELEVLAKVQRGAQQVGIYTCPC